MNGQDFVAEPCWFLERRRQDACAPHRLEAYTTIL